MKKLFGFTLAEVLITLGIIGVVAALTIPTLMQKTKRHEYVAGVKKFYANLTNAIKLAEVEHGTMDKWENVNITYDGEYGLSGEHPAFIKYIMDNMKVTKSCGKGDIYSSGCFPTTYSCEEINSCPNLDTSTCKMWPFGDKDGYSFILADGSSMALADNYWSIMIVFDVNGAKGPNKVSEDVFEISYDMRTGKHDFETVQSCGTKSQIMQQPCGFGYLYILQNGNMDYLDE